jgi:D-alanyl-D-alanine carboxypeptidase
MIQRFLTLAAVILIGASPCEAQIAGSSHPLTSRPELQAALTVLDAWIARAVAEREQPGLSIGIVYDQDLIWAKGYGYADVARRVATSPATSYRIGSISKLFTATAVMQLRDAGRLRLDDPIVEKLPWFTIQKTYQGGPPITIRHLLTHTSGLPRDLLGVNFTAAAFPTRDAMPAIVQHQQTTAPPATMWAYSNLAVSLAGEIVAHVSGEAFAAYIERYVLQPLGMNATRMAPTRDMPGLATGYSRRVPGRPREVEPFVNLGAEAPAGEMSSTVEDLAKFISLQFRSGPAQGAQVLQASTLREMHRVQWLHPDWRGGSGLGFQVRRVGDKVRVGHGGGFSGYATSIEFAPEQKLGVIVLTNANDGNSGRYGHQAFELVGPAIARVTEAPSAPTAAPAAWQAYVGTYVTPSCSTCAYRFEEMQIQILNGQLTMISSDADNPWAVRIVLIPQEANTFTITSPGFSYEPIGETLTFEVDGTGKAIRVRTPNATLVPK